MMTRAVLLLMLATVAGCARMQPGEDAAPVLSALTPDSVLVRPGAVIELTLAGSGFRPGTPGGNTVHLGGSVMRQVRANDEGTRIVVAIPDAIDSGGEAPPVPLVAGGYEVQVETSQGRSNALTLRVFR